MSFVATLLLVLARAPQQPPAVPPSHLTCEELLVVLRGSDLVKARDAMESFAQQADAPAALVPLLEEMRKSAPWLDNNVGLAVEQILRHHPDAPCPLEPLLEALGRHVWNSQQKCAQALLPLLERGDGKGREQELCDALIPMLTSQRPRVFGAGRRCLEALTSRTLGDQPEPWLAWYEQQFGRHLDLAHAVYEDLIVVRPRVEGAGKDAAFSFEVEGKTLGSNAELRALLAPRVAAAAEHALALGVVIQLADERLKDNARLQAVLAAPEVAAVRALLAEFAIEDFVVSPMSDAFRAPWKPAAPR